MKKEKCLLLLTLFILSFRLLLATDKINDSLTGLLRNYPQNDTNRIRLLNDLAQDYVFTDIGKAHAANDEALHISTKLNNDRFKAESYRIKGYIYSCTMQFDSALSFLHKAYHLFNTIGYRKGMAYTFDNIGLVYFRSNNFIKSQEYYEKSLKLAEQLKDDYLISYELHNVASVYSSKGEYNAAIKLLQRSLKLAQKAKTSSLIPAILEQLASDYSQMNDYSRALDYCYQSIHYYDSVKNKDGLARSYITLFHLYYNQKDYNKALENGLKGLKLAEEIGDSATVYTFLNSVGTVYLVMNNIDKALKFSTRSLIIANKLGDEFLKSENYLLLAQVYKKQKNYNQAITYYKKSLALYREMHSSNSIALVYCLMAEHFQALNNFPQAIAYADSAFNLAKLSNLTSIMQDATLVLHISFAATNDYKAAYKYLKLYKQINDSIQNNENTRRLIASEMEYKFEKEMKQRELEQAKNDLIKEKTIQRQRFVRNTLIISLILVLLLALVIYRSYRIKSRSNLLLANQNAEINRQKQELQIINTQNEQQNQEIKIINAQLKQLADELMEMDNVKTRFFTNISHEFRTPLSLIIGPVSSLMDKTDSEALKEEYAMILKHANRLLNLINQLLDLSKLKKGIYAIELTYTDIALLLKNIVDSFSSLAKSLQISLDCSTGTTQLMGWVDVDKFEKIVINLVSNAIKYNKMGGSVFVSIRFNEKDKNYVNIQVTDNGIGIHENDLKNVFEPFYRSGNHLHQKVDGIGIGLALVKELTELHGGQISLESTKDKGTTFTVRLAVAKELLPSALESNARDKNSISVNPNFTDSSALTDVSLQDKPQFNKNKPTILIVEDNEDLRLFIKKELMTDYNIIEANNGQIGYNKALKYTPDLIVADVMMPVMTGFEMTQKVKTDKNISHIPVILLTAMASEEHRIEGLEARADDYVVKPFNRKELLLRIQNSIQNRQRLREKFERSITVNPSEIATTSLDEQFLKKALEIVEEYIDDETLDAERFSKLIGYSRNGTYKKLVALTGQPTTEFIRSIRLKRAAQLITQKAGSTTEIAYKTGFSNLSYFSKCFKEYFGVNPSEFIETT